ncbi:MAG: response regulator [Sandaracinaceae bacterium]|nr:response regulator [Sandaracinaceae bacterium]
MSEVRTRVLVIEDEAPMRRFLRTTLNAHGYAPIEAASATEGLALATQHGPELVLLDLGLPDRDGLEVTGELRQWSEVPIIVLSARGLERDKVAALDAGADDYLTKPFGVNELLARIRVAMRHRGRAPLPAAAVWSVGPIEIDDARHEVRVRQEPVHLTPIEYRLLAFMARNAGRVLTHRQLLHEVWGPGATSQTHYLRVYMTHLRRKMERDPARPALILNEPGVGYRLCDEP